MLLLSPQDSLFPCKVQEVFGSSIAQKTLYLILVGKDTCCDIIKLFIFRIHLAKLSHLFFDPVFGKSFKIFEFYFKIMLLNQFSFDQLET